MHEAQALDGRWFDVYACRWGAPELRHVAILFTDISVRRRLEEKTQEQADSLAELNRRKDQFLAMLSHELRNPLAAIRHAAELIQMERNPDPIQLEAHEVLEREVAQLTRLVDDLLDVSRISTGHVRLQVELLDLRDAVRRAIEIIRPEIDRKGQTLTLSLPDKVVRVLGDDARLQQVVVNLLDNANKYTDRSGLLTVELRTEGDETVLCVRDNGTGIEPEHLPSQWWLRNMRGNWRRLFTRYFHMNPWQVIELLYDSEINAGLETEWNRGVRVWIAAGGRRVAQHTFSRGEFEEVGTWLDREARLLFPRSRYATQVQTWEPESGRQ